MGTVEPRASWTPPRPRSCRRAEVLMTKTLLILPLALGTAACSKVCDPAALRRLIWPAQPARREAAAVAGIVT